MCEDGVGAAGQLLDLTSPPPPPPPRRPPPPPLPVRTQAARLRCARAVCTEGQLNVRAGRPSEV
eukprot:9484204-Pyramimonas_sp.AAC.1